MGDGIYLKRVVKNDLSDDWIGTKIRETLDQLKHGIDDTSGMKKIELLLRLLRSLDVSANLGFLVGVGVNRRGDKDCLSGILLRDDVCVFVGIGAITLDHAVGDDGQDPEHPKEDADTTSEHKSDRSSLPGSKGHECKVKTIEERGVSTGPAVHAVAVVTMGVTDGGGDDLDAVTALGPTLRTILIHLNGNRGCSHERQDVDHTVMNRPFGLGDCLDERQAEGFAEGVRDFERFLTEAGTAGTTMIGELLIGGTNKMRNGSTVVTVAGANTDIGRLFDTRDYDNAHWRSADQQASADGQEG